MKFVARWCFWRPMLRVSKSSKKKYVNGISINFVLNPTKDYYCKITASSWIASWIPFEIKFKATTALMSLHLDKTLSRKNCFRFEPWRTWQGGWRRRGNGQRGGGDETRGRDDDAEDDEKADGAEKCEATLAAAAPSFKTPSNEKRDHGRGKKWCSI